MATCKKIITTLLTCTGGMLRFREFVISNDQSTLTLYPSHSSLKEHYSQLKDHPLKKSQLLIHSYVMELV